MMKKAMALVLCCLIVLTACVPKSAEQSSLPSESMSVSQGVQESVEDTSEESIASLPVEESSSQNSSMPSEELSFDSLSDPDLLAYLEDDVYAQLVEEYDSDEYFVENVEAIYLSKEYLDEVAFNSQENVFFGYTLSEIHEQFEEGSFIFTLDENNQTVVQEFEKYDDTYEQAIKDVAVIGGGAIVLAVTIRFAGPAAASFVGKVAPAVNTIFTFSSSSKSVPKIVSTISSDLISGVISGITVGIETKDFDKALEAAMIEGSEELMWSAISGISKLPFKR